MLKGEVIDATYISKKALLKFVAEQIAEAKEQGVLFSLHMKATMMKVSDPIIFGHVVKVFFQEVFDKHRDVLEQIGANANDGLGAVIAQLNALPAEEKQEIMEGINSFTSCILS